MSLVTTTNVARDQIAHTEDVVRRQLNDGLASVVEPGRRDGIFITWAICPNQPSFGLGFGIRDFNRAQVELGARVTGLMGGVLGF